MLVGMTGRSRVKRGVSLNFGLELVEFGKGHT